MDTPRTWYQGAVVYQIYPRSFLDSTGNGVGDLQGVIDKLDYLGGTPDSLGVTAIWLSPIYKSPMADFGYDVADYCDVDPLFGSLDDLKVLVQAAHKRSIKVIMDFVPNHSSDEHPWFTESRSSLTNPKRDWYVWRDAKPDGSPPNNWLSVFGGSAWQFSPETDQYYLHSYLAKQPDLNWDNPAVREAMKAAMRFWLDLGIDGFRVDAVDGLSKDAALRDDPINENAPLDSSDDDHTSLRHLHSRDGPHLFEYLNEMTKVLSEYPDLFMINEAHPETDDKVAGYLEYYKGVNPSLSAPFNFQGIYLPWEVQPFRQFIDSFQAGMQPGYTPIYTVGNHDESRIASRIGSAAARTAALMLLTLPGMAFVYYGEELGMHDSVIPADKIQDPFAGIRHNRDPERTPMQWDASDQAGFTSGIPWLPVADDYASLNVMTEQKDPDSMLNLYKRLLHFRRDSMVLLTGSYRSLDTQEYIFSYMRECDDKQLLVVLNFSAMARTVELPVKSGEIQLSTHWAGDPRPVADTITLEPNEGIVIAVS